MCNLFHRLGFSVHSDSTDLQKSSRIRQKNKQKKIIDSSYAITVMGSVGQLEVKLEHKKPPPKLRRKIKSRHEKADLGLLQFPNETRSQIYAFD